MRAGGSVAEEAAFRFVLETPGHRLWGEDLYTRAVLRKCSQEKLVRR